MTAVSSSDSLQPGILLKNIFLPSSSSRLSSTSLNTLINVLRGDNFQCTGLTGLYPCGEGAGYAGGIMTAAVDGVRCAAALMQQYAPDKA